MSQQAQRGDGGIAPTHSQPGTGRRWVVSTTPRPLYPRERSGIHFTEGSVGFGTVRKVSLPTGIDPRTVYPVASLLMLTDNNTIIHFTDF
jgi:hypothetical protein